MNLPLIFSVGLSTFEGVFDGDTDDDDDEDVRLSFLVWFDLIFEPLTAWRLLDTMTLVDLLSILGRFLSCSESSSSSGISDSI